MIDAETSLSMRRCQSVDEMFDLVLKFLQLRGSSKGSLAYRFYDIKNKLRDRVATTNEVR
jgi:hypothetical protein